MLTLETIKTTYEEYKTYDVTRGFITYETMSKLNKMLGLENLNDEELSKAWEMVNNFFAPMVHDDSLEIKEWVKVSDAQSAWLTTINEEARKRRNKN